ncbi:CLUMA_CG011795, isoform A [Clunio marinus]|uniref:CLUMA_CG011795, isoform A n=1 Tax=Clunio marinus TaxID=568069 RepID=A0A1J1IHD2_9DIPT|nr:CLUMA_CG011795, isoform A [Clunio marinus]
MIMDVMNETFIESAAVGFKKLGNYHITDVNENSNEKIYFVSIAFRGNWMSAQSFCRSYGMDLVALESEHEAKYFMKSCEKEIQSFEAFSHIGGVFESKDNKWHWITSSEKINFELKFSSDNKNEGDKKDENCLQLVKDNNGFSYGRTSCFGDKLQPFVCQRMIIKMNRWKELFGK